MRANTMPPFSRRAFTIVELLVVIAIIGILAGLLIPVFVQAKHLAREATCSSNLRQINYALACYAGNNDGYYPIEPTEHNPHPGLLHALQAYSDKGMMDAFYCPQANFMQHYAQNTGYTPKGAVDTIVDTAENRAAGNISYVYWSFLANKKEANGYWRGMPFFPRVLTSRGIQMVPDTSGLRTVKEKSADLLQVEYFEQAKELPISQIWVLTDFFRRGMVDGQKAPFAHVRFHQGGMNVLFLDGHVGMFFGRPRDNFR